MSGSGPSGVGPLQADLAVDRGGFRLEVELRVAPGETLALLGPNGAGKSTIVDLLAGIVPLDRGRLTLGDRVLDEPSAGCFVPSEDRNIGIVFQDPLLFDHLSVTDNIAFPLRHRRSTLSTGSAGSAGATLPVRRHGRGRRAARLAVAPLLHALELTELADERPDRLSGGQAQRVALARALAGGPDLLLLDEPLAAVDISTRARLRRTLVTHLDRFAGPRLVITHDPAEAIALADRLAVIENGRLVQEGRPEELERHPATPWVAALTGSNLVAGLASASLVTVEGTEFVLTTTTDVEGPVNAVIEPKAIALHRERPRGSPRNTWASTVDWVEPLGRTTRVRLADPLPLNVDITPSAAESLGLGPGSPVWAAVKATEIRVQRR